jgi:hypothetical protein
MLLLLLTIGSFVFSANALTDRQCFDTYQTRLSEILTGLPHSQSDFDNQLRTIESALGVHTPLRLPLGNPMAIPLCTSSDDQSNFTIREYDNANRLNTEKIMMTMKNNRTFFRLLLIQKAALDRYDADRLTTPCPVCPTRPPRNSRKTTV